MIDFLYDSLEGKRELSFVDFRALGLTFLTEIRKDIGIFTDELTYKGSR